MSFPERLLRGYQDFCSNRLPLEQARFRELAADGQQPEVMVIGCCDSRVSPEVIFDAGPGELFVVRNVANLVPPCSPDGTYHGVSSALEFAVLVLGVRHVVVLGHAQCGGVRAFAEKARPLSEGNFIGKWISLIEDAAAGLAPREPAESTGDYAIRLEQASVLRSIDNLMTFPFVASRVADGRLALHGSYFGVASGDLTIYDPVEARFRGVAEH